MGNEDGEWRMENGCAAIFHLPSSIFAFIEFCGTSGMIRKD